MGFSGDLLSIVVPVYNVAPYLEETLDSIRHQTFQKFRVLCIDDVSTDESYDILKKYGEKDNRFLVLRNPYHLGAARTRNIGIQLAQGKYIMLLDADDIYNPMYFEKMCHEIERTTSDIVVCKYAKFDDENHTACLVHGVGIPKILEGEEFYSVSTHSDDIFTMFKVQTQSRIYRRLFIADNGLQFQNLENANDIYFNIMAFATAKRIGYLPETLVFYRYKRKGSITSAISNGKCFCIYDALKKCYRDISCKEKIWNSCRRSFFDFSIRYIVIFYYNFLGKEKQSDYQERWRKQYLHDIGMGDCKPSDFTRRKYFDLWKQLMDGKMGQDNESISYKIISRNLDCVKSYKNIIIYGAGMIGMETEKSLQTLGMENYFFAQTEVVGGEKYIGAHKVYPIERFVSERDDSIVLIAVEAKEPVDMMETLHKLGFKHYLSVGDY